MHIIWGQRGDQTSGWGAVVRQTPIELPLLALTSVHYSTSLHVVTHAVYHLETQKYSLNSHHGSRQWIAWIFYIYKRKSEYVSADYVKNAMNNTAVDFFTPAFCTGHKAAPAPNSDRRTCQQPIEVSAEIKIWVSQPIDLTAKAQRMLSHVV